VSIGIAIKPPHSPHYLSIDDELARIPLQNQLIEINKTQKRPHLQNGEAAKRPTEVEFEDRLPSERRGAQ